jgi:hypothetical protein
LSVTLAKARAYQKSERARWIAFARPTRQKKRVRAFD